MPSDWVDQATSPGGILAFVLGIISAIAYHSVIKPWWCKRHGISLNYHVAVRLSNIVLVVGALAVVWIGVKQTDLTTQVAECQKQFNLAIVQGRQVTIENDDLSIQQRLIIFNWMHDLVFPPAPISEWSAEDPRRQQWGLNRTIWADQQFKKSIDEQTELIKGRVPLPDPTCGRES